MGWHSPSGGEAEKRHQDSTGPLSRKLLPLPGLPVYSSVIPHNRTVLALDMCK